MDCATFPLSLESFACFRVSIEDRVVANGLGERVSLRGIFSDVRENKASSSGLPATLLPRFRRRRDFGNAVTNCRFLPYDDLKAQSGAVKSG